MAPSSLAVVFYGVAYEDPGWSQVSSLPWNDPPAEDESAEAKPEFNGDAEAWYLHQIGLGKPKPKQSPKAHAKEREAAIKECGLSVGTHGGPNDDHQMTYIAASGSRRVASNEQPMRLPKLAKDPKWDKDLKRFFKLAGLPFDQEQVGWWVVSSVDR